MKKVKELKKYSARSGSSLPEKEWTIIVYMAGDNNLSEDMITSLKDLKKFAGHSQVNVIVFYDSSYPPQRIAIYDFSKKPPKDDLKSFEIENAVFDILRKNVPTGIVSDSFDPKIEFVPLIKFVPWVLKKPKFKAKKYALVLAGHADSVLGRTILRDDNPPNSVTLKTLGSVLETCRAALQDQYPHKKKFDLLGFDSCLMGMIESAYEIKDTAEFMVASEGNIPDAGWNYAEVFKQLIVDNGTTGAEKLALTMVENYARYNFDFIASGRSINISAYDLKKTEAFAVRLNMFAAILLRLLNLKINKASQTQSLFNGLFKQKFISYVLQSHYYSQTFMHDQAMDIVDFEDTLVNSFLTDALLLSLLLEAYHVTAFDNPHSNIDQAMPIILRAIKKAVKDYADLPQDHRGFVLRSCFSGAQYQFSKGVAVFFPWSQMPMKMIFAEYSKLKFSNKHRNWRRFIRKYIELTNRTPETKLFYTTQNLPEKIQLNIQSRSKVTVQDNSQTEKRIIDIEFQRILLSLLSNEEAGRQYIGRQYIGRQYIGRGDAFYDYFSQLRNYSPFKLDLNAKPPEESGLIGCNS